MKLNPFKESNLSDLQQNLIQFFSDHFTGLRTGIRNWWKRFVTKGREKLTVMFIPHSEKRIVSFHISIFTLSFITGIIVLVVVITSIVIINHSSAIKEVSKLKTYGSNYKVQIGKYKEESNKLYLQFQRLKPELTHLYSLTPGSDIDSLWGKGGYSADPTNVDESGPSTPPIEVLNIQEVERDLKITKNIMGKLKTFLEYRKKIIDNTPSIWPVNGYIISRFGKRNSPFTLEDEFHNGIDIEAFPGSEIKATAPGTVSEIRWDPMLGLTVTVKHKYGFNTSYSHCQRVSVDKNQRISKGEVIGYVGRTGKTTKYICLYQIKIGVEYIDPMPYLNKINK